MKKNSDGVSSAPAWLNSLIGKYKPERSFFVTSFLFFLSGCFAGFFIRSYGKQLLGFLALTGIIFYFLTYGKLITIHYARLVTYLGIHKGSSFNEIVDFYRLWAQEHLFFCFVFIIGFFIGWRTE